MIHNFDMSGIVLNEESLHPSQFIVVAGVVPGEFRLARVCVHLSRFYPHRDPRLASSQQPYAKRGPHPLNRQLQV
jgi:hypothetical protein